MTDWGAHHFGGATFAVDVREVQPVEVIYHDDNKGKYLTYRYPNGLLLYHNRPGMGNLQVEGTPGEKRPAKPVPTYKGNGGIYGDFIHCVKTREKPFRDIELAVTTAYRFAARDAAQAIGEAHLKAALDDLLPTVRDQGTIDRMTLLALDECRNKRLLPRNHEQIRQEIEQRRAGLQS